VVSNRRAGAKELEEAEREERAAVEREEREIEAVERQEGKEPLVHPYAETASRSVEKARGENLPVDRASVSTGDIRTSR
jgi:hypothetical protein